MSVILSGGAVFYSVFRMKNVNKSIGRGKIIVEFFSAEIVFSVCILYLIKEKAKKMTNERNCTVGVEYEMK